jgi:hypothetical protein
MASTNVGPPAPHASSAATSERTYTFTRTTLVWLIAFLTALIVSDVALIIQNRSLKTSAVQFSNALPSEGTMLPPLEGIDLAGHHIVVPFDGNRETLLLVFSPTCHFCMLNWPTWQTITARLDQRSVRVVYANLSNKLDLPYVSEHRMSQGQILAQTDAKSILAYRLQLTPETMLIGANGKMQAVWPGLIDSAQLAALERALRPHLLSATGE